MASTDARPVPRKNTAYRAYFELRQSDRTPVISWNTPSGTLSLDGATAVNSTNTPTEITPNFGMGYIDLTASEMNYDAVAIKINTSNASVVPTFITLYPEEAGDYRCDVFSVSGVPVGAESSIDANIIRVSGEWVSINDFKATSVTATVSSGDIAQAVWEYGGTRSLTTQNWSTHSAADVWTTGGRTLTNLGSIAVSGDIAEAIWTHSIRSLNTEVSVSGYPSVDIYSVSGIPVSIDDFGGSLSGPDAATIADAVWDEDITTHVGGDKAGQTLITASGNLIGATGGATAAQVWQYANRSLTTLGDASVSGDIAQAVWDFGTRTLTTAVSASGIVSANVIQVNGQSVQLISPSGIADAVWDEPVGDHQTLGSTGEALVASGVLSVSPIVSAVWNAALGDYTTVNTMGWAMGIIGSGIVQANIVQVSGVYISLSDLQGSGTGSFDTTGLATTSQLEYWALMILNHCGGGPVG